MCGIASYFLFQYSPYSELGKKGAQILILLASNYTYLTIFKHKGEFIPTRQS